MCGRYILTQKAEVIEKRFNISIPEGLGYKPSYNIGPGQQAAVITGSAQNTLTMMTFGLTPSWAKKPMYLFNARAEGDRNKEDWPLYAGSKDIITKPAFRTPIRSKRCLVLADAFIEGTTLEKLAKPYLVYLRNQQRPFAMAGIWDTWLNPETRETMHGFAIITTAANSLMQMIPHHRCPLILPRHNEARWLRNELPLSEVTAMMHPFPAEQMNAYPISQDIRNIGNNALDFIQPKGERLMPEVEIRTQNDLHLQGMGHNKKRS